MFAGQSREVTPGQLVRSWEDSAGGCHVWIPRSPLACDMSSVLTTAVLLCGNKAHFKLNFQLFFSVTRGRGALGIWFDLKISINFLLLAECGFSVTRLNCNLGKTFNDIVCWARQFNVESLSATLEIVILYTYFTSQKQNQREPTFVGVKLVHVLLDVTSIPNYCVRWDVSCYVLSY